MISKAKAGALILIVICGMALFAGAICPNDPLKTDLLHRLAPPCPAYPLGYGPAGPMHLIQNHLRQPPVAFQRSRRIRADHDPGQCRGGCWPSW